MAYRVPHSIHHSLLRTRKQKKKKDIYHSNFFPRNSLTTSSAFLHAAVRVVRVPSRLRRLQAARGENRFRVRRSARGEWSICCYCFFPCFQLPQQSDCAPHRREYWLETQSGRTVLSTHSSPDEVVNRFTPLFRSLFISQFVGTKQQ